MAETRIYLDNAATTRVSDRVLEAMLPWLKDGYGNASSPYSLGRKSAAALSEAREKCAGSIGADKSGIIFTSGATESNNLAIRSAAYSGRANGRTHLVTTVIEHPSVLEVFRALGKEGFSVTYLPVNSDGIVYTDAVRAAVTDKTALVSVMFVNNETGTIQPVEQIGAICRENGALFHVDAVQAAGFLPVDVDRISADFLSLSGHKIHAMKGVGMLYARKNREITPILYGGGQESGKRSGTENIAGIVGFSEALVYASENIEAKNRKLAPLQKKLIDGLLSVEGAVLNGSAEKRVFGNVNVSFDGIESETLVFRLDMRGIAVSGGSACSSVSGEASHVITALGASEERAKGAVRFTMSEYTTEEDIEEAIRAVKEEVAYLKQLRYGK